jgi:hypothetical protein
MWGPLRFWGTALLGLAALPVIVTLIAGDPIARDAPVWEVLRAGVMLLADASVRSGTAPPPA